MGKHSYTLKIYLPTESTNPPVFSTIEEAEDELLNLEAMQDCVCEVVEILDEDKVEVN